MTHIQAMPKQSISKLMDVIATWATQYPDPSRRDLAWLVQKTAATMRQTLTAITDEFDNREKYPQRPMILVSPPGAPSVWLLGWRKGDWTPIHDHVKSQAAVHVLQAEVEERVYWPTQATGAALPEVGPDIVISRELHIGSTITVPTPYVHAVGNDQEKTAATLHAYWPPLRHMDYYEQKEGKLIYTGRWDDDSP